MWGERHGREPVELVRREPDRGDIRADQCDRLDGHGDRVSADPEHTAIVDDDVEPAVRAADHRRDPAEHRLALDRLDDDLAQQITHAHRLRVTLGRGGGQGGDVDRGRVGRLHGTGESDQRHGDECASDHRQPLPPATRG